MKKAAVKSKKTYATLMYIPENESTVKSYRIPSWMPRVLAAAAGGMTIATVACIMILSFVTLQYNNNMSELEALRKINSYQKSQIAQLEQNANDVQKQLQENIAALNEVRSAVGIKNISSETGNILSDPVGSSQASTSSTAAKGSKRFSFVAAAAKLSNLKNTFSRLFSAASSQQQEIASATPAIKKQLAYIRAIPDIRPVMARITCNFGYRTNPFTSRGSELHKGVDFGASYGTTVHATGDGKVTFAGYKLGYGRLVIIDHGYGVVTLYAHNSKLLVETGDKVKKNEPIARSGNNGRSTGPHVHYEVQVNGVNVNPESYFN